MYARAYKRIMDFFLSLFALIMLSPLFIILTFIGMIAMKGNPFFVQKRPGKDEKIFFMFKFRTMNNCRDFNGNLLPDEERLNRYGRFLRSTSLDELPELVNILKGDMSLVGPRPQLVRDLVFMSEVQRKRQCIRPGLTGLAQVNGRNNITWEEKLEYDLLYIDNGVTFVKDFQILLKTVINVLNRSDVVREGTASDIDFGDWLLLNGVVEKAEYDAKQKKAKELMRVG